MPRDDRDQNFEKALASSLRSSDASANATHPAPPRAMNGDDCLDAEILAAYHERLLDPEELAQRKEHIASCERCQDILAQLDATDRIAVEADRDLMLDQVILDLPESTTTETLASESIPAGAASEPLSESAPEPAPTPEPAPEPEFEIEHEPDLIAASAALPSLELSRAAAASVLVTAPVAAAPKSAPSSATITFRPPRSERPKLVRFVALAGALAAGLLFWLVIRDHSDKPVDLAQNHAPSKLELPPQSPAPPPSADDKEKDATSASQTSEPKALPLQSRSSITPAAAQPVPAQPRSDADSVTNSLDDAKKTIDSAKSLEQKSRTNAAAAGKPDFSPRDESTSPAGALYSARAVPQKSSDSAARKLDAVIGSSTVGGPTNASTGSGSVSAAPANSLSGIPATPPPARTKMVPGVVSESVPAESGSPVAKQTPASSNQPASIGKDESLSKSANGRVGASLTPLSVPAPSGTTIWRIGQAGMIQRSTNSGATWSIQPSGVVLDLIAGSAYSDQVCWLVGRNGTVLRTTNGGITWRKLNSPSNVDLLSVFSINADSATVTDAAGRAFETTTAGTHWSRTQLQP